MPLKDGVLIQFHDNGFSRKSQGCEEFGDGDFTRDRMRLAVENNSHYQWESLLVFSGKMKLGSYDSLGTLGFKV